MAVMQVVPEELASAAEDVGNIGTILEEANAYAALPTSTVLPAGGDAVSAAITPLFNDQSTVYQELAVRVSAFHREFTRLLSAAGAAYTETEQAAQQALRDAIGEMESPLASFFARAEDVAASTSIPPLVVPQNGSAALIVGGTTFPLPNAQYVGSIMTNFLDNPTLSPLTGALGQSIYTPEQFWPLTRNSGT